MGFFDWLFGRNKKKTIKAGTPQTQPAQPRPTEEPTAPEHDDDFADATTFVSRRLSASAQREIKSLRNLLARGVQQYAWAIESGQCVPCQNGCKRFVDNGPYSIGLGLSGQAPVPGRESPSGECQCTVVPASE